MKPILARVLMLVFCVALAAAVFVESLRQHLSASYGHGAPAARELHHAGPSRQSAPLALTMDQRVA
jgi:hypothetical protein